MIYIYNCYGGTHSSILAMAYHLKMLDETREPTKGEILGLPNFNKLVYGNRGELFYYGESNSVLHKVPDYINKALSKEI